MDFECICLSVHYHFPLFSLDTISFILSTRDNSLWLWCLSSLYQVDIPLLTTAGWLSVDLLMTVWFNWLIVPEELKLSGSCFSLWQAWYLTVEDRFRLVSFPGAYVVKFVFLALECSCHSFLALVACWNQRELWQKADTDARDCEVTPICRFPYNVSWSPSQQ